MDHDYPLDISDQTDIKVKDRFQITCALKESSEKCLYRNTYKAVPS